MARTLMTLPTNALLLQVQSGPHAGRQIAVTQDFTPGFVSVYGFPIWYKNPGDDQFKIHEYSLKGPTSGATEDVAATNRFQIAYQYSQGRSITDEEVVALFVENTMRQLFSQIRKWVFDIFVPAMVESITELTGGTVTAPVVVTSSWDQKGSVDDLWEQMLRSMSGSISTEGKVIVNLDV